MNRDVKIKYIWLTEGSSLVKGVGGLHTFIITKTYLNAYINLQIKD